MTPRIPPIPPSAWPPEMRAALAVLRPEGAERPPLPTEGRPKALNALGMLAHHPTLARAFNTFNGHVLFTSTLTDRQRELLVLRVAARREAAYEWAQHVVLAADAGISDDEVACVRDHGGGSPGWSPLEAALLDAADQLVERAGIDDPTWAALAAELDERQLLDVVFTVGCYDLLAMAFSATGVELDDDLRKRPSP